MNRKLIKKDQEDNDTMNHKINRNIKTHNNNHNNMKSYNNVADASKSALGALRPKIDEFR